MAERTPCSAQDPCLFSRTNVDKILHLNCQLLELTHRANSSSAHMQCSGQRSACLSAGDATSEELKAALAILVKTVTDLKEKVDDHDALHQMRTPSGRQETAGDSGVGSGLSVIGSVGSPIQETADEGEAAISGGEVAPEADSTDL